MADEESEKTKVTRHHNLSGFEFKDLQVQLSRLDQFLHKQTPQLSSKN